MNPNDHNPDTNPHWTPLVARRIYACEQCGTEQVLTTNHTGTCWASKCAGRCRRIIAPHTASERVLPFHGPHRYVKEVNQ